MINVETASDSKAPEIIDKMPPIIVTATRQTSNMFRIMAPGAIKLK